MWLVYKKELLELTRDKKTLIFTILLPIFILPLIIGGFGYFSYKISQKKEAEILKFAIVGAENAPELVKKLDAIENFSYQKDLVIDNVTNVIRDKTVKFVLVINKSFSENILKNKQAKVILHYNAASRASKVQERLKKVIAEYSKGLQKIHMAKIGILEDDFNALVEPIKIQTESIANNREKIGEIAGGFTAYFMLLIALSGAIYPALDLGVGEKERQTLETLLLNPLPRWHLVMAKFGVIFTTGFISVFLTLFSLLMWTILAGQALAVDKMSEILSVVGLSTIGMMMMMLIPTAAFFAAVLLTISIYARNFKEAQNYMSPLMIMVILPVMMAMVPGIELNWSTVMIPLTNIALAMKEILKGTIEINHVIAIFGSTTILAGIMLWFCNKWFQKEAVLFRT